MKTREGKIRDAVLAELRRIYPNGRDAQTLAEDISRRRMACDVEQSLIALAYLEDKGMAKLMTATGTDADHKLWQLTAAGVDYVTQNRIE